MLISSSMPSLSILASYNKPMKITMQRLTHTTAYIGRRKKVESKHHGTVKELTSEHQRFDQTEILYSLRKNGGYV